MSPEEIQELASVAAGLSPEAADTLMQLARVVDEVIDNLPALEGIATYGRDCQILAKHLANLHDLRRLRQNFERAGDLTGAAARQTS